MNILIDNDLENIVGGNGPCMANDRQENVTFQDNQQGNLTYIFVPNGTRKDIDRDLCLDIGDPNWNK